MKAKRLTAYRKMAYGGDTLLSPRQQAEESQKKLEGAVGSIPVYGQIIQGFSALGRGIGKQTTDQDGIYKNKFNEAVDNSFNPSTAINNIKGIASGDTSASNILNFATLGIAGKGLGQEQAEEFKRQRQSKIDQQSLLEGAQKLNSFDTAGSNTNSIYAKYGGKISTKYLNGGSLTPLSSDSVEVEGNSHEQGGVKLSPEIEVEGKETINDDFVFSDELGFAARHKPIARAIGKMEKKVPNNITNNTINILKKKEEALKQEQEQVKQMLGLTPIAGRADLGGDITKFVDKYLVDPAAGSITKDQITKTDQILNRPKELPSQFVLDPQTRYLKMREFAINTRGTKYNNYEKSPRF